MERDGGERPRAPALCQALSSALICVTSLGLHHSLGQLPPGRAGGHLAERKTEVWRRQQWGPHGHQGWAGLGKHEEGQPEPREGKGAGREEV